MQRHQQQGGRAVDHLTRPEGSDPADFHLSRRGLAGALVAGYAVAALSAEAAPVVTPEDGLVVRLMNGWVPRRAGNDLPTVAAATRPDRKSRCRARGPEPGRSGGQQPGHAMPQRLVAAVAVRQHEGRRARVADPAELPDVQCISEAHTPQPFSDMAPRPRWTPPRGDGR